MSALPGNTPIHDLIRRHDWSTSPIGAPEGWPQSLRYIVTMMLESTIPMSVVWGPERVLLYNQSYVLFLGGKHPAQAFGLPIRDVWPEIWSDIGPLIERAAGGEAFYLEDVPLAIHRDGADQAAWFTFSYSPVRDDSGALNGMCSSVLETTSRVLAEQRQAFLLSLSGALGKLADPELIMRTAARMACAYLKLDRIMYAEPDFDNDLVRFLPGHADPAMAEVDGMFPLNGFGSRHVERLARGEIVTIDDVGSDTGIASSERNNYLALDARSVIAIPLLRSGKALAVVIVNQASARAWKADEIALLREIADYTWNAAERARAERDMRRLTATLEERIAERTAELERAMTVLRDTDRHKDQFLAMLAHELRNPLAPISAATAILKMPGVSAERIAKTSDIIGRQVKHMVGMVDDLLDVSRVTRGRIELERHPVAINAVVADAIEQVRPLLDARRHDCRVAWADASVLVDADAKRLVQVISNVLNNAAKYTLPGGDIGIRAGATDGLVRIDVTDNGIGIPPDMLPYVFDLFVQGVRTVDRAQGGLGIGLALVKSLVELHGGTVEVDSPGKDSGTTVGIVLPRWQDGGLGSAAQADDVQPRIQAGARRVMVVDDNVDAASMLALVIEGLGFDVAVEHDPVLALQRAGRECFDIFLLDIGMPGVDGNELARRLRQQPDHARALLVAISGYGSDAARQTALAAGFDHYLTKPADVARLAGIMDGTVAASPC